MVTKGERFEMRLTQEDKKLIEKAAAMTRQSVSQFSGRCLVERAREIVDFHETTVLSARDFDEVMRILDSDESPPRRLVEAVKRHRLSDG